MPKLPPILVTGSPRSGTTFTGDILATDRDVLTLYEPFNKDTSAHIHNLERFAYISADAPRNALRGVEEAYALATAKRYAYAALGLRKGPNQAENPYHYRIAARELWKHPRNFTAVRRVCVKDPIAFFAAEWMSKRFDAQPVVLFRHPAGVISSYKKLHWQPEVDHLFHQPGLAEAYFPSLSGDYAKFLAAGRDWLQGAILQWRIFATATLQLMERNPHWAFVSHETISTRPQQTFRELFDYFSLDWSGTVSEKVRRATAESNVTEPERPTQHALARNSTMLTTAWQNRLTAEEATEILNELEPTWIELMRHEQIPSSA